MFRICRVLATTLAIIGATSAMAAGQVVIADTADEHGNLIGATTTVDPLAAPAPTGAKTLAARPRSAAGEHAVAVIPMTFGSADPGFTVAALESTVFSGADSVDAYYRESTYGRLTLTGRVFPIVSISTSTSACNFGDYASAAITALRNSGESITGDGTDGFDHYMFVFPRVAACSWAGLAQVPGRLMWINGYVSRSVMAHEFGHNIGLGHANALHCQDAAGAPTVLSSVCSESEYGDPFEVMGVWGRQLSAAARQLIGVLTDSQHVTVTSNATITLQSASVPGDGIKSIEIPRPGTRDVWFVEMRSTSGYDTFPTTSTATEGVLIRRRTEDDVWMTDTQLIDATPETSTVYDAAFLPGTSFTDPTGKLTITVISRSGDTASIRVSFGATSSTTAVNVTTSPSVARSWSSKIVLYRRPDGRLRVGVRRVTSAAPDCRFRIRGRLLATGSCTRLRTRTGWQVVRTLRAGGSVVVNLRVPGGQRLVSRTVRAPLARGTYTFYRLR